MLIRFCYFLNNIRLRVVRFFIVGLGWDGLDNVLIGTDGLLIVICDYKIGT